MNSDFIVIGGGIVGLASAWKLAQQYPDSKIRLFEKESKVASHQSGRNSGVLHSGIYYKPGSLKATTCRAGKVAMEAFCEEHAIQYENCGKVIVAVDETEVGRLDGIYDRGQENGIHCRIIDEQELHQREPNVRGVRAIEVPESGIVDYPGVCEKLASLLIEQGHEVHLGEAVIGIVSTTSGVSVRTNKRVYSAGFLVSCAGLQSDRLVKLSGLEPPAKIVPFRGEYFELVPNRRELCRHLIYPVPDPNFPFLGVHFTRMVSGDVECGPNAVFALAREGYSWSKLSVGDVVESFGFRGFRKLAAKHWRMGMGEVHRSLSKAAFVKALQRLIPSVRAEDLKPCRAGVRAQALTSDGQLVDDFLWVTGQNMLHVCNAPSPAATASLEIGRHIVERVAQTIE